MKYISIVMAFLLYAGISAAELDSGAVAYKASGVFTTNSSIRESPPHGFLNLFVGKTIKKSQKDTEINIIGKKTYGGFSGTNVWYQIESTKESTATYGQSLWVYGGVEGKKLEVKITK